MLVWPGPQVEGIRELPRASPGRDRDLEVDVK